MNYLYRTNMEKKEDTLGKGTWPYLKKKLTVLIVGDVLVIEGETKKELQRVRRVIGTTSKGKGARFTWGRYIETPIMGVEKGVIGKKKIGSMWQVEGRVTSQVIS
jgi:hypothetical protein